MARHRALANASAEAATRPCLPIATPDASAGVAPLFPPTAIPADGGQRSGWPGLPRSATQAAFPTCSTGRPPDNAAMVAARRIYRPDVAACLPCRLAVTPILVRVDTQDGERGQRQSDRAESGK